MLNGESLKNLQLISGGQTGADRAALDVAMAHNFKHGGWCPKGRYAEDGVIPRAYRLCECDSPHAIIRTEYNVKDSDVTIVFTFGEPAGGSKATIEFAQQHKRPWLHVNLYGIENREEEEAQRIKQWLAECYTANQPVDSKQNLASERCFTVNIAGSRESNAPGIYNKVKALLTIVLKK